jgi:hypothetical protein
MNVIRPRPTTRNAGIIVIALLVALSACRSLNDLDELTSDNFRHTAEQQSDFDITFALCKSYADRIVFDRAPATGEEARRLVNASDHSLAVCMQKRGYPYRERSEVILGLGL